MSEFSNQMENDEGTSVVSPSLLGMTVYRLREHQKMSQADLARAANVAESVISRIENGKTRTLHKQNLEAIANALQVKPAYLRDLAYGIPPESVDEILNKYTRVISADIQQVQDELIDVMISSDDRRVREQAHILLVRCKSGN